MRTPGCPSARRVRPLIRAPACPSPARHPRTEGCPPTARRSPYPRGTCNQPLPEAIGFFRRVGDDGNRVLLVTRQGSGEDRLDGRRRLFHGEQTGPAPSGLCGCRGRPRGRDNAFQSSKRHTTSILRQRSRRWRAHGEGPALVCAGPQTGFLPASGTTGLVRWRCGNPERRAAVAAGAYYTERGAAFSSGAGDWRGDPTIENTTANLR